MHEAGDDETETDAAAGDRSVSKRDERPQKAREKDARHRDKVDESKDTPHKVCADRPRDEAHVVKEHVLKKKRFANYEDCSEP